MDSYVQLSIFGQIATSENHQRERGDKTVWEYDVEMADATTDVEMAMDEDMDEKQREMEVDETKDICGKDSGRVVNDDEKSVLVTAAYQTTGGAFNQVTLGVIIDEAQSLPLNIHVDVAVGNSVLHGKLSISKDWGKGTKTVILHLYFDPHLIANANFGNLVISVTSKDLQDALIIDSITRFTCKLPGARTTIGTYVFTGDFESPLEVAITAEFSESLDFALQPSPPPSLTRALRESINGSEIVDVKFLLFSSRSPSGVKGAMTPLFAKASVIKGHSDHLDTLLSADSFKESSLVNLDEPLPPAEQSSQELFYDYESDSDLHQENPPEGI
ncbi:hypothetical protein ONZ45_g4826 [Pleurotus djamor]|nr:hypothetical protein ONZ45_g4826 [Pleurotus djamor]